jgi:hypothetical protein
VRALEEGQESALRELESVNKVRDLPKKLGEKALAARAAKAALISHRKAV